MTLTFRKRRHATKLPHYIIADIKPLGHNTELMAWLKDLGIWQAAQIHLKEIYYYSENEKQQRKHFYAAGHQNENGSWQLHAKNFHGLIGHPGLTILDPGQDQLQIFPTVFDYLHAQPANCSIIIVNDLKLRPQALAKAKEYREVVFHNPLITPGKY